MKGEFKLNFRGGLAWETPGGLRGCSCDKDAAGFSELDAVLHAEALEALAHVEQKPQVVKEEQHRGCRVPRVCAQAQYLRQWHRAAVE